MTSHDEFATWDAAYVLGALSPTERREYESHLRECDRCTEAVGELAGMPGILSRVPREQAMQLLGEEVPAEPETQGTLQQGPGPEAFPTLLHRVRRRRMRTRWLIAGLSAAAAAVVVGIGAFLLPAALHPDTPPAADVVMQQVQPSALSADLRLTEEPWGTRIDWRCQYAHVGAQKGGQAWTYAMVVTDRAGKQHEISTWTADEGTTATPVATTSIPLADIAAVDIRSAGDGTVLLRSTFD